MNLKEQSYVCKLAETGSITKAAEELYISQPGLSLYISNLENNLGVKLFTRSKSAFVLTYIGEKYVEKAKIMLKLQNEFNLELSSLSKGITGRLRIGVQLRRSPYIIPEIAKEFKEKYSNIELVFRESNTKGLEQMLDDNLIDMIICSSAGKKSNLDYLYVFDDNLLLAVNKYNKITKKAKSIEGDKYMWIDLEELKEEKFILPHKGQSMRESSDTMFKDRGFIPKEIMEIRNIETIMNLVSQDFGIGLNRISYANHMSHIKNVVYFSVLQDKSASELVISYPKSNNNIPNFIEMINYIKQTILSEV